MKPDGFGHLARVPACLLFENPTSGSGQSAGCNKDCDAPSGIAMTDAVEEFACRIVPGEVLRRAQDIHQQACRHACADPEEDKKNPESGGQARGAGCQQDIGLG